MHGAEGAAFFTIMSRQRTFAKHLTTLRIYNKSNTCTNLSLSRSRNIHTKRNNTGSNINGHLQSFNKPSVSLARISSQGWSNLATIQQYQQLRFTSVAASPSPVNDECNTSVDINDPRGVLSKLKAIKSLDEPLIPESYQAVMEAYENLQMEHNIPISSLVDVYEKMLTQGVRPTSEIYAIIIRSLCVRCEQVNRAINAIRHELDINAYVTEGSIQLHPVSVDNMVKARHHLNALESENNIQRAVAIFEQAVGENKTDAFDVGLYNKLLRGLSYTGNTQDGIFVYEQLENGQVRPNSTTFIMLLSLFGKAGDLHAVKECFNEYKAVYRELPRHDYAYVYNTLVSAHVNAGDLRGALRLVEKTMVKHHIPVTISPYNKILSRASMENNMELVSRIVDKLNSNSELPNPDATTYGILLSLYSRSRNLDMASEMFDKVMSMNPDRQYGHLNEYLAACVDKNELGRSMDAMRTLSAHGKELNINQCCKVVNSYMGTNDIRGAAGVVKEIIQLQSKAQLIDKTSPLATLCMEVIQRTDSLVDALDILRVLNLYSIRLDDPGSRALLKLYDQAKADSMKWNEFVEYCTERSYFTLFEATFITQHDTNQFSKTVFKLLNDMHGLNIRSNPSTYLRVGTRMTKLGAVEDKARWDKMFGDYYPDIQLEVTQQLSSSTSTTSTLNNTAMAEVRTNEVLNFVQSGDFDKALVLMKKKIIDQGMVPAPTVVCAMIRAANKLKLLETATNIYNMAVEPYNQLGTGARRKAMYMLNNCMMIIHSNNKNVDATKLYYDKLRADGMYPTSDGYGALLNCAPNDATNDDSPFDAMKIYEKAKKHDTKPTLYLYNVVISKLGKSGRKDQALAVYNDMQENGVQPDSVTFGTVISTCLRCGSEAQAVYYFDEMARSSCPKSQIAAYNSMIQFYVRERGDRNMALMYFEKLKHTTWVPDIHTYRLLIEAYANTPDYDMVAACNLLTDMKKQFGLDPVASHYATLIRSYGCVHHDVASAEAMFDKMVGDGIRSNEPVYRALLDTYISNDNLPKAETIYKAMLDAKLSSSPYIENLFIKGYGENGDVNKAEQVFNKMQDKQQPGSGDNVIRDFNTYEALIKVYLNHGQIDKAYQVRNKMKKCGFPVKAVDGVSLLIEQGQANVV